MPRVPLHVQILIALVVGTVVGAVVNPGDVPLDETPAARVSAAADGTVELVETRGDGSVLLRETIPDEAAFARRYPELAAEWQRNEPRVPLIPTVSDPRLHLVEEGPRITLTYLRRYDGAPAVTTIRANSEAELEQRHPAWAALHRRHGGGPARAFAEICRRGGDLFLRLLRMISVPLVVTSLVTGVAGLGSARRLGTMFRRTLLYYVTTSALAILTGLLLVNLIRPGIGARLPGGGAVVAGADRTLGGIFFGLVEQMIPVNPVESLARGEFLAIITFSILVGICLLHVEGPAGRTLVDVFSAGFDVMMRMTTGILKFAPLGVLCFVTHATATQGLRIFAVLGWYMLTVLVGLFVHGVLVLPAIVRIFAKRSPWEFARAMSPALTTAFSTASSNGALPLTIASAERRAGLSNRTTSFVLPLGATVNMDGTALYEAVAVLFVAQAYGGDLSLGVQAGVALTALLASVGAAGIPHAGLVMMAIVLQAAHLPLEAQGVIIAVDRVLDMARTTVNVWSDACGCAVIDRMSQSDPPPET